MTMSTSVILYAPNVHTGGGYVLLRGLLLAWPGGQPLTVFLDERARGNLPLADGVSAHWVRPSVRSRWQAERALRAASGTQTTVLCFHGLPPLLSNVGRVVLFQQNRLYLGLTPLSQFGLKTAVRLAFGQFVNRIFRHRVARYLVQTPSMARELTHWYGKPPRGQAHAPVQVLPFVDGWPEPPGPGAEVPRWDFIYVSHGESHKNHRNLLAAWRLLAEMGLKPSLALTLGPRDQSVIAMAEALRQSTGAAVSNLGHLPREQVLQLYGNARALIFPSTSESFGLPLIEARCLGLPVLAPEADYVRDVCIPAETFDPMSPVSIARAVQRFLGQPEPMQPIGQAADLWKALQAPPPDPRQGD
jgi:glycosyltransferase involved in cell wall biosynthesis